MSAIYNTQDPTATVLVGAIHAFHNYAFLHDCALESFAIHSCIHASCIHVFLPASHSLMCSLFMYQLVFMYPYLRLPFESRNARRRADKVGLLVQRPLVHARLPQLMFEARETEPPLDLPP